MSPCYVNSSISLTEACTKEQIKDCEDAEVCLSYDVAASADIEIHPDIDEEGGISKVVSQEGKQIT